MADEKHEEMLQDLALKLDLANMELRTIDEALARRPALDVLKHRTEKIERCCAVNGTLLAACELAEQSLVGVPLSQTDITVLVNTLRAAIRKAKGE